MTHARGEVIALNWSSMTEASGSSAAWVESARARWPSIELSESAFVAHLRAVDRSAPVFPLDMYLAAACAARDPAALRVLDDELIARVPAALRRLDAADAFATEICQQLRVRLLVGEAGAAPRIARYTGEVPLSAWLRVIALRLALNAKRGARDVGEPAADAERAIFDPEIDYLRSQYAEPFARSFEQALEALSKDDRTILRLHYVDGVNIDGIGRIYQVHRATVARWLVRIRSDVLSSAKRLLAATLGADLADAASVVNALAGELEVTLSRVLRSGG
jgi:RNA polymerase sigma-70 factor (ECF subfamily)